jgi:YesN/AraC family two-component response regulator
MPNMDGMQMSSEVKKLNDEQSIVIISAHNEVKYLMDLIDIGIEAFLIKPIQTENLVNTLSRVSRHLNDTYLLKEYQKKMEDSYYEMMQQKEAAEKALKEKIECQNQSLALSHAVKTMVEEKLLKQYQKRWNFYLKSLSLSLLQILLKAILWT